jgi:hypothetical protein
MSKRSARTSTQDKKWCTWVRKAGGTAKAVNAAIVPPEIVFWRIFYVISRHTSSS